MQKFSLQSSEEYRKNSKVNMVYAGEVSFDEAGKAEIEVENEGELAHILASYPDLKLEGSLLEKSDLKKDGVPPAGAITPNVQDQGLGKSGDAGNDIGNTSKTETELSEVEKHLSVLGVEELKALAAEYSFPNEEWEALEVEQLKSYLKGKLEPVE